MSDWYPINREEWSAWKYWSRSRRWIVAEMTLEEAVPCAVCGFSFGTIEVRRVYEGCDSSGGIFTSKKPMHVDLSASDDDDDECENPCMIAVRERIDTLTADLARVTAANEFARREWAIWEEKECRLRARLDAVEAEFRDWLDATRKGLDAHAEVKADRDRLAACVERVRGCERVAFYASYAGHVVECETSSDSADTDDYFRAADILAALEGA